MQTCYVENGVRSTSNCTIHVSNVGKWQLFTFHIYIDTNHTILVQVHYGPAI